MDADLSTSKAESLKLREKRKAKKRASEEVEQAINSPKKSKIKTGKELDERNKKWKEKKKMRDQKETMKKVRKV